MVYFFQDGSLLLLMKKTQKMVVSFCEHKILHENFGLLGS